MRRFARLIGRRGCIGDVMEPFPEEMLGPKMLALRDDRQRRFALLMAQGAANATLAARGAGYSDVKEGAKVQAHHLMQNQRVLDAIEEAGRKVMRGLQPIALAAAKRILENPEHSYHGRMIETVLDRTGFSARTEHKVTVEHTVDTRELEALARRLALENGIDPRKFIGINSPSNGTEKINTVIEGEVVNAHVERRGDDRGGALAGPRPVPDAGASEEAV